MDDDRRASGRKSTPRSTVTRQKRAKPAVNFTGASLAEVARRHETGGNGQENDMKTKQQLIAEALEAEFREDEARLDAIVAKAEATDAKAQMDEVSGLKAARERVRGAVRELETNVAADFDASKLAVERGLRELEAGM